MAVAATRAKDDFISRVSHELRTPLTTVLGFGELLQSEELTEDNRDSVDRIVRAGRHLLNLINDLLDIGRIERGYLTLNLAAVGLREEVEELLANMAPLATRRGIVLESMIGEAAVVADRQRLQQILLNLVSNAIKYNHEGGRVVVSDSERPDGMVRIEVYDTGPGIAEDALDRIFVPFERLEAEREEWRERGSDWRSPRPSPRPCTGGSGCRAPWASGRRSGWSCRSGVFPAQPVVPRL